MAGAPLKKEETATASPRGGHGGGGGPHGPARRLIVGLGNPGPRYEGTRHNVGFAVVERLAARLGAGRPRAEGPALVAPVRDGGVELELAQPLTYMNRSGVAVRRLLESRRLGPEALLVIYDDIHLPLGTLRVRPGGSAGGHNGMKSIIAALGTEAFARLRVGIGPSRPVAGEDLPGFVLSPFTRSERPLVDAAVEAAADAARVWAAEGVEAAMARFNGWKAVPEPPPGGP